MNRIKRILAPIASLRLTVVILSAALVLVFAGTLAQVKFGLWAVQEQYFQSWFIWLEHPTISWKLPIYPGGHLIGLLLLLNLSAAFVVRFSWNVKKLGIHLTHLGLVIMLVGGLITDLFSVSSYMRIREGQRVDYSADELNPELAVVDVTDPDQHKVTAIPGGWLEEGEHIKHESLPFTIKVLSHHVNSTLHPVAHGVAKSMQPASSEGIGSRMVVQPLPKVTKMRERDVMSAVVELTDKQGESLGSWLVSDGLTEQMFPYQDRVWSIALRPERHYKPYTLTLLDFTHETYPGTNIPKDFSSTVMLDDDENKVHRKVRIFMNNPLRYDGETFYQSGFSPDNRGTVLNVVRNPGYQAPYVACALMSLGLMYQFSLHLVGFTRRKRKVAQS